MFRLGAIATGENMNPFRQSDLYKKKFAWIDILELNPQQLDRFG
jgi:hypothetical protein